MSNKIYCYIFSIAAIFILTAIFYLLNWELLLMDSIYWSLRRIVFGIILFLKIGIFLFTIKYLLKLK